MALERLLGTSKVMYCEKCGFTSTDPVAFKTHMIEHGTRFYCFYCNAVSFSEAELNEHLKQHTSKYPFKCLHCGQGYMRKRCMMKHIDRFHSNSLNQGPAKSGMTKALPIAVSSALRSAPTADSLLPPPPRPVIRVAVPTPTAPAAKLGKTLDTNLTNTTNGNTERLPHLNGLIQPNRALTVSLPEEVNIPAGCLVELVEVKTVNGTKELKLRLISQQENESVIKNTKPAVLQDPGPEKPLSSTLHHPNTMRSVSASMCTGSRKQSEIKTMANVGVNSPNNPTNVVTKEKVVLKRPSTEIINLECDTVIPNKVSKTILTPMRDANTGIRVTQAAPVNHLSSSSGVVSGRGPIRLNTGLHPVTVAAKVSQRIVVERNNATVDLSKSIPPRRLSDTKDVQEVSAPVKLGAREVHLKSNSASKEDVDVVEQPEENQGPIEPLVMALRGIVMHKKQSASQDQIRNGTDEKLKAPASGRSVQQAEKNGVFTCDVLLTEKSTEGVKVKKEVSLQSPALTQNNIHIKKEENGAKIGDTNKCSHSPDLTPSTCEDSKPASPVEKANSVDKVQQAGKGKVAESSRFLTISLKRVQVGIWKKSKKGLKVQISRDKPQLPAGSLDDCTVIYPMPLKEDQLVKRPGPNQPVVVLNHPKPRACVQRTRADSFSDIGVSDATPKCQILKMRLSKGIGQSYEVMGCTMCLYFNTLESNDEVISRTLENLTAGDSAVGFKCVGPGVGAVIMKFNFFID
ncbi:hypothetical protein CCH79_00005738 [Gambusia affinis]|uniref:C2H2-type domain-containing protein n=1 Tax=Gambusia affinis TaxID=33528 RepID=A0A315V5N3_GAMAF|nr:hypothetical protein CCH79_00005738 [Gambusia affinis]